MTERIKNIFRVNKLLKLASILIAIAIWLMVVNISDPEIKSSVSSNIEVDYEESLTNLDKYYSIDSYNAKVSFSVRTNQRTRVSASDFRVYVDMRDYSITGALPVYVTVDDRIKDIVSDVTVSPLVVHATTEDMQEKTFDVVPNITGTPYEGFAAGSISYSPSHVTIYGPNSEIGKISRIGFNVNIEGAASNVWGTAEFIYYDANDNEITPDSRIVVKNSVSYDLPIYEKKNITVMAQTTGDPAEGYELGSVNIEPDFVEVYGDKSVLDSLTELTLPASLLNISGATGDVSASVSIKDYLPDGIYTNSVGNIALVARINKQGTTSEAGTESSTAEADDSHETAAETESSGASYETPADSAAESSHAQASGASGNHSGSAAIENADQNIREGSDLQAAEETAAHENAQIMVPDTEQSKKSEAENGRTGDTVVSHGSGAGGTGKNSGTHSAG